jgi:diguanylate cyclase (GGDEF)-like protein
MLTRVANRRGFERRATERIAAARRCGDPLAAIMLDLDHFKQVNDRFGHATGDTVLHAVAQAIDAAVPAGALVARLGGEEFVALLDRTTAQGAVLTGEAIRGAVAGLGPHLPSVTISGGIATLRADDTLGTLLDRADRRAYEAKQAGRDRIYPLASRDR